MMKAAPRLAAPPEYITRHDVNLAILREINRQTFQRAFLDEFQRLAPAVVTVLIEAGVIFPEPAKRGTRRG